ncbi:putative transcription initiation factor TFIID subunit [Clavispora lusitaniae]|uniref:Transcription initiation factor TFIID subunit n=1 Tax=Clavispora lusitaniae TaxID=36911 RepID=A0ACD0WL12_CLALS|nr:putative transcription initiation factor TFIID subunit [Clavispora lusitaniae]QFZ33911.1 putative transcription initiation factor TFIID subunit [Clavispora lusitaniae]QFZ39595.1 putative transcription initiation factor TFIID subunit [Clavispora lusitaniae]QFZ45277.1 putative transcription initiation factor TFIID subunit [Clavispora lusitaniae]QFZ50941.1 putative transcription initiation factor TFIID subunit [Clavispora lusitaniae]
MRRTSQRGRDTAEDQAANTDRRMAKRNKHQTHKLAHQIQ